jgi:NhaA family Na+:H+ antiporter
MPLFALANAGVSVRGVDLGAPGATGVAAGAALGLLVGKPIGIVAGSLLAVKLSLCKLPRGVGLRELIVVGTLGGIGFTMAIFVAMLAFPSGASLGTAKLAVLVGSSTSAVVGLLLGRALLPATPAPEVAAITTEQAESSTDY